MDGIIQSGTTNLWENWRKKLLFKVFDFHSELFCCGFYPAQIPLRNDSWIRAATVLWKLRYRLNFCVIDIKSLLRSEILKLDKVAFGKQWLYYRLPLNRNFGCLNVARQLLAERNRIGNNDQFDLRVPFGQCRHAFLTTHLSTSKTNMDFLSKTKTEIRRKGTFILLGLFLDSIQYFNFGSFVLESLVWWVWVQFNRNVSYTQELEHLPGCSALVTDNNFILAPFSFHHSSWVTLHIFQEARVRRKTNSFRAARI